MFSLDFIYKIEINNYCFFKIICEVLSKKTPQNSPKNIPVNTWLVFISFCLLFYLSSFIVFLEGREIQIVLYLHVG